MSAKNNSTSTTSLKRPSSLLKPMQFDRLPDNFPEAFFETSDKKLEDALENYKFHGKLTLPENKQTNLKAPEKEAGRVPELTQDEALLESYFKPAMSQEGELDLTENGSSQAMPDPFTANPQNLITFHILELAEKSNKADTINEKKDSKQVKENKPVIEIGTMATVLGLQKDVRVERLGIIHNIRTGRNLVEAVVDNIKGKETDSILEDFRGKLRNQELAYQLKKDKNIQEGLNRIAADVKQGEKSLEALAKKSLEANGFGSEEVKVVIYNSDTMTQMQQKVIVLGKEESKAKMKGFYDSKRGVIYMNAAKMDGSNADLVATLANELSHYVDEKNGRKFDQTRQNISTEYGKNAFKQVEDYSGKESIAEADVDVFKKGIRAQDFGVQNNKAGKVVTAQPHFDAPYIFSEAALIKKVYEVGTDGRDADEDLEAASVAIVNGGDQPVLKVSYVLATELLPLGDILRIGVGIDPYTCNRLSWIERKNELIQTVVLNYSGKVLKSSKAISKVIKPKVFDLQDNIFTRVDVMNDVGLGLDRSFTDEK